ncbi:MAG: hybrid sensor histidine kinase/response regulator [Desulfuromonadales bacterium]
MADRIKVLAVDDEEMSLAMLSTVLIGQGMECLTANNGRAALDVLESTPDVDIVLLDLQMPIMDGFEVVSYCKGNPYLCDIPIIVLAADRQEKLKSLKLGGDDFLAKPFDLEELELRISRLIQSRRMLQSAKQAKNEFLTIARNELRTPMLTITGLAENLDGSVLSGSQRELVNQLKQTTGRLTGIIRDILNYVQLDHQALDAIVEPFSLRSTIQSAIDSHRELADQKGLRLILDITADVPDALIGPSFYVYKACDIVLENAIRFSSDGEVRVEIRYEPHGRNGVLLYICISDQGIGIPTDFCEKIFEPFVQVDQNDSSGSHGLGLGLAIAKRMVELMGGSISAQSDGKRGSTLRYSFLGELQQSVELL